jgi:hypothetical protein
MFIEPVDDKPRGFFEPPAKVSEAVDDRLQTTGMPLPLLLLMALIILQMQDWNDDHQSTACMFLTQRDLMYRTDLEWRIRSAPTGPAALGQ